MSLSFTKLTENASKLLPSAGTGEKTPQVVSSTSPLATLIQPLKEWYNTLSSKQEAYDDLALGLEAGCDAVADDVLTKADAEDYSVEHDSDDVIKIPKESYSALFSGLLQGKEKLGENSPILNITSNTGLVYSLQLDEETQTINCVSAYGGITPVGYIEDGECYLKENWPSNINDVAGAIQSNNVLSHLQRICDRLSVVPSGMTMFSLSCDIISKLNLVSNDTLFANVQAVADYYSISGSTINELLSGVEEAVGGLSVISNHHATESVITIAESMVASASLNADIVSVLSALFSGRTGEFFSSLEVGEKKDYSRKFFTNCKQSFGNGGARGLISYLYSVIKTADSLVDEDGLFIFTDNSSQMPKEFIAGAIGTILSSTLSAIGMALTVVQPIVGAIISVVGGIAWSIFGSFNQSHSDTKASLSVPLNEAEELSMIDASPIALLRGEDYINSQCFSWYKDFYNTHKSCSYVAVPGGFLFVGPGEINDAGELVKVRYEFHPIAQIVKPEKWSAHFQYAERIGIELPSLLTPYLHKFYIYKNPDDIARDWFDLINNPDNIIIMGGNEATTGVLSDDDDSALLCSQACATGVFLYWLWTLSSGWMSVPYSESNGFIYGFVYPDNGIPGDTAAAVVNVMATFCYMQSHTSYNVALWGNEASIAWKDLVACGLTSQGAVWNFGSVYKVTREAIYTEVTYTRDGFLNGSSHYLQDQCSILRSINSVRCWNLGVPLVLPASPKYAMSVPKLNSRTFWLWAATTIAVSTAVVVGTVVFAVKFNKWRKRKVAENAMKNQNLRNTYQSALDGQKWDPEQQKMVDFDVNSPEGQAFIDQSYKAYYKQTRKANFMAKFIGGSRFDTTSFYGDAAVDDSVDEGSTTDKLKSLFASSESDMVVDSIEQNTDANLFPIVRLIAGVQE